MTYIISESCINCGTCEAECPQNCISPGDTGYQIDENCCIDCGACARVCPADAARQG